MRRFYCFALAAIGVSLLTEEAAFPAHILEPLGTEISATPPRGRMFGQIEYFYSKDDPEVGPEIKTHLLPMEFEVGVGERTQLNMEATFLLEEKETSSGNTESGVEEMAFGLKHRFLDETPALPDAAFLVEFAPAAGLNGDRAEVKGTILLTKNLTSRFLFHLETGYGHESIRTSHVIAGDVRTGNFVEHLFIYNIAPVFRFIPEKLLFLMELNGESNFRDNLSEVTLSPEVIFALKEMALKLRVPFGLTDESQDLGIHFGISKLF